MCKSWSFDVTVSTHDDLKRGVTELRRCGSQYPWRRVTVSGATHTEAFLTAYAMSARPPYEVTGMYLRI